MTRIVAWFGFFALLVLHLDFWRPQRPVIWFGWIPEELAYRFLWLLLAWLYLFFFTAKVWREEEP